MTTKYTGDARITDEALAELRGRIGQVYPARPWNTLATLESITHFADGMGDDNPLFRDPEFARKTKYGRVIAPPTFVYTFCSNGVGPAHGGLPGIYSLFSEDVFEFHHPVYEGKPYTADEELVKVEMKPSAWGGQAVHQFIENRFYDDQGAVISRKTGRRIRAERPATREHKKYTPWQPYRYSDEEIERISAAYVNEFRRGPETLYWEDAPADGAEIPTVVKGPLTVTDIITWLMGWGSPLCKSTKVAWLFYKKHPGAAIFDPDTNVPDLSEAAHWDPKLAQRGGVPGPYDIGPQRISWFAHLLTNWAGDEGWLSKLAIRLTRPNLVGDTTWLHGRITRKYKDAHGGFIDFDLWGATQRGDVHSTGTATVRLPLRTASRSKAAR